MESQGALERALTDAKGGDPASLLSPGEATVFKPGLLRTREMEPLEWVQQRATKIIKGLGHVY